MEKALAIFLLGMIAGWLGITVILPQDMTVYVVENDTVTELEAHPWVSPENITLEYLIVVDNESRAWIVRKYE